jgi:hypothetical protein
MQQAKIYKREVRITLFLWLILSPFYSYISAQNDQITRSGQHEKVIINSLNEVGAWPFGRYEQVAIDEPRNLAYVNSGGVVLIIDISTFSSPVLVNDSIRTKGVIKDISYNQTTQNLYVTLGANGLEIWDVQNINSPQLLSSLLLDYAGTIPPANKMVTKPGFIFVAAEYAGIITINVSDPANPYQSSYNTGFGGTKYSVSITEDGNYLVATSLVRTELFAVNFNGSLSFLDVSAALVGGWEVHVSGLYSYEINNGILHVLDLTTLGLPIVASYNLPGNSTDHYAITSSNNRLYVSDPFYGIEIFDITNPANPSLLGSYQTACNDIKYFNSHVFVPDNSGMSIFDVTDPANPAFTSNYQGVGGINRDLKISDSYCYLVTFHDLYVLDISNPVLPELVGINQPSSGIDLHIQIMGNYAYLTNTVEGLRVVDISDPSNPVTVGSVGSSYFNYMTSEGNYIYVTDNQNNLRVFDISNPATPVEVGTLNFPAPNDLTSGIAAHNGYVYVSQYEAGLKVIDVTDPTQPTQVSTYNQNVDLKSLDAEGNYVYATDIYYSQSRVYVFDVSDPLNPIITGTKVFSSPPPHAWQNFAFGDVLLVSDHTDPYLAILDISNPSQPSILLSQMVADEIWGADVTNSYIYLAAYGAGLHIYENPYGGIVPVESESFTLLIDYVLLQNYPNPFNPITTIRFNLPNANHARLVIYNILGQEVRELANGFLSAGKHEVIWDGTNNSGIKEASGIYFYTLQAGDVKIIKKMMLSK